MPNSLNLLDAMLYKKPKPFTASTRTKYYKELTKMGLITRPENSKEYLVTDKGEILVLLLKSSSLVDFINNAGEIASNVK